MKKCFAALSVVLVIAGCGSKPQAAHNPSAPRISHCEPADYMMQCALTTPAMNAPSVTLARPVAHGIDFGWGGPSTVWMRSRGYGFGASYLSTDPAKNWSVVQARTYYQSGISLVFVWETTATRAIDGCGAGIRDARLARAQGAPFHARAIYFAVDFELQSSQVAPVESYFRCIDRMLGVDHVGGYGGYWTVRLLFGAHLIRYGWQTYAWSGGLWDSHAQLQQFLNGSAFDYDRAVTADYGQTPGPKPKPHGPTRLRKRIVRRTELRRVLLEQHCRVKHPSPHCRALLHRGAVVNREIRALGGH